MWSHSTNTRHRFYKPIPMYLHIHLSYEMKCSTLIFTYNYIRKKTQNAPCNTIKQHIIFVALTMVVEWLPEETDAIVLHSSTQILSFPMCTDTFRNNVYALWNIYSCIIFHIAVTTSNNLSNVYGNGLRYYFTTIAQNTISIALYTRRLSYWDLRRPWM